MSDDLARRMLDISELRGDFELSSGARSPIYFDKFRFLCDPRLLGEIATRVRGLLPQGVDHLAAPEGAATLILAAVASLTGMPMAVVRRETKSYGTRSQIEGYAPQGSKFALIEDVSTTGQQVAAAAKVLEDSGSQIVAIVLVLDRGGADVLRDAGYDARSMVSLRPKE